VRLVGAVARGKTELAGLLVGADADVNCRTSVREAGGGWGEREIKRERERERRKRETCVWGGSEMRERKGEQGSPRALMRAPSLGHLSLPLGLCLSLCLCLCLCLCLYLSLSLSLSPACLE
jgi:hypothetical protein